jgi:hypothetical protein
MNIRQLTGLVDEHGRHLDRGVSSRHGSYSGPKYRSPQIRNGIPARPTPPGAPPLRPPWLDAVAQQDAAHGLRRAARHRAVAHPLPCDLGAVPRRPRSPEVMRPLGDGLHHGGRDLGENDRHTAARSCPPGAAAVKEEWGTPGKKCTTACIHCYPVPGPQRRFAFLCSPALLTGCLNSAIS